MGKKRKKQGKREKPKGRFKHTGVMIEGKLDFTTHGSAYLVTEDGREDIYISKKHLNTAFNGDVVRAELMIRKSRKKPEAEVVEIVKRSRSEFIGTVSLHNDVAFILTDPKQMPSDVYIRGFKPSMAADGELVSFTILEWPKEGKKPVGKILKRLGRPGENDTEIHSILVKHGLPYEFPKEVLKEADEIPVEIPEQEIAKRLDMRNILTFTIDPEDAQDFDDAISYEKINENHYKIGVHIADVSYYVRPYMKMEEEAAKRATSIYLVDRVVPMLPEKISNVLCSLRPKEDKLTYTALFDMDKSGKVLDYQVIKTVIHSNHRFVYEEVQDILEDKTDGPFAKELKHLNEMAHALRKQRFEEGSLSFESSEVRFKLDKDKKPIGIEVKVRKDAHLMIEDFMLLANKTVSKHIDNYRETRANLPFVYRIHDEPNPEKLEDFRKFAATFGYKLDFANPEKIARSINDLSEKIQGKPEQELLEKLLIRCMSKAEYSTDNIGHYGLGFEHYSHFTSPIRRYPDVLAHRLLFQYSHNNFSVNFKELEEQCLHSSQMERKAMEAERDSVKFKQVEYMSGAVGKVFNGIITGIMHYGLFVEIMETMCEGLAPIDSLPDDNYLLEPHKMSIKGMHTDKVFKFGDRLQVKVTKVDMVKKQIDLEYFGDYVEPL